MEIIIIAFLSLALIAAIAVIYFKSQRPDNQILEGNVEVIAQALQSLQTEQKASQEIQRNLKEELRFSSDQLKNLVVGVEEREKRDQDYFQNLLTISRNIESVMRGSKTKGIAGENIVREILKVFPHGSIVYDFKLGGKVVEFAIKLPDGRILPLDSKIVAAEELTELATITDEGIRLKLIQKIEMAVLKKAKEVREYISPPVTYERAIMALPDAIYYLLKDSVVRAHEYGVLVIPYSMTIPYILTFLDLHRKHSSRLDEERVKSFLEDLSLCLNKMDDILDNKVAKGSIMIQNAYSEYKQVISKVRGDAMSLGANDQKQLVGKD